MADKSICKIDGCGKPAKSRGWCPAHYERWRRLGGPEAGGGVGTSRGEPLKYLEEVVLTFAGDSCLSWPYAKDVYGYGQVRFEGKTQYVTRIVCERVHGPAPSRCYQAAHSCGKGHEGCYNPAHLRWATVSENHLEKKMHGTFNPPPIGARWKRAR